MLLAEDVIKESIPVQDYAAKVRREGQREGREQGKIDQARYSIASILRSRFPRAQPGTGLDNITTLDKLNRLLESAATARTIAEFRRSLANGTGST